MIKREFRLAIAGLLAVVMVVALTAIAYGSNGRGKPSAAQYQYAKKVTICHKGKNTITVSVNALPAHKAHGDTIGACSTTSSQPTGKNKNHGKP